MVARVVSAASPVAPHGSDDRCPGAVRAIAADDGALARVRVPGGYLGTAGLRVLADIAERYGDGELDITARANVQLRGLREGDLAAVVATLESAGLLPSAAHERVRNIVGNPFAGVDPTERCDVRPFVVALDRALVADLALVALPPKFLFAFDGGGRGADTRGADLVARASAGEGVPRFAISVAGGPRVLDVGGDDVVPVMLALARHALAVAEEAGCAPGTWRLATLPSQLERIPSQLAAHVRTYASVRAENDRRIRQPFAPSRNSEAANVPLGIFASVAAERIDLVPSIPLGRINAVQAVTLAELACEHGADVRLASWRGVVLGDFPRAALARAQEALAASGIPLDTRSGFAGVAACAGRGACDAALADVRGDAATYAAIVAQSHAATRSHGVEASFSVNFAGCAKRCAMRRGADVDVVATVGGYDVWLHGKPVAALLDAAAAIALATEVRVREAAVATVREGALT